MLSAKKMGIYSQRLILAAGTLVLFAAGWLGLAGSRGAQAVATIAPIDDVDEERAERLALGKRSFQENCLMCHAENLAAGQRLTKAQWVAEVDKMIGWGAPVPPDQKDVILEYLNASYSTETPPPSLERMPLAQVMRDVLPEGQPPQGNPERGHQLYTQQCANCHGPNARGADLGTNLVDRPVLLRPQEFARIVTSGLRRMPGFEKALNASQEADILAWLKQQRFPTEGS